MKQIYWILMLFAVAAVSCSHRTVATPPEPVVIERPPPPYSGAVYIEPGYRWNGTQYVVVHGRWVKPRYRRTYAPGHWQSNRRGHYWVRGHWR